MRSDKPIIFACNRVEQDIQDLSQQQQGSDHTSLYLHDNFLQVSESFDQQNAQHLTNFLESAAPTVTELWMKCSMSPEAEAELVTFFERNPQQITSLTLIRVGGWETTNWERLVRALRDNSLEFLELYDPGALDRIVHQGLLEQSKQLRHLKLHLFDKTKATQSSLEELVSLLKHPECVLERLFIDRYGSRNAAQGQQLIDTLSLYNTTLLNGELRGFASEQIVTASLCCARNHILRHLRRSLEATPPPPPGALGRAVARIQHKATSAVDDIDEISSYPSALSRVALTPTYLALKALSPHLGLVRGKANTGKRPPSEIHLPFKRGRTLAG